MRRFFCCSVALVVGIFWTHSAYSAHGFATDDGSDWSVPGCGFTYSNDNTCHINETQGLSDKASGAVSGVSFDCALDNKYLETVTVDIGIPLTAGGCGTAQMFEVIDCGTFCSDIGHNSGTCNVTPKNCSGTTVDLGSCTCTGGNAEDVVDKVAIEPGSSICTNTCSGVDIKLYNSDDEEVNAPAQFDVRIFTRAGSFYSDNNCQNSIGTNKVEFLQGQSSKTIYYQHNVTAMNVQMTAYKIGLGFSNGLIDVIDCSSPSPTPNPLK